MRNSSLRALFPPRARPVRSSRLMRIRGHTSEPPSAARNRCASTMGVGRVASETRGCDCERHGDESTRPAGGPYPPGSSVHRSDGHRVIFVKCSFDDQSNSVRAHPPDFALPVCCRRTPHRTSAQPRRRAQSVAIGDTRRASVADRDADVPKRRRRAVDRGRGSGGRPSRVRRESVDAAASALCARGVRAPDGGGARCDQRARDRARRRAGPPRRDTTRAARERGVALLTRSSLCRGLAGLRRTRGGRSAAIDRARARGDRRGSSACGYRDVASPPDADDGPLRRTGDSAE